MTITDFFVLFGVLFFCNYVLVSLLFNMQIIGQTVNTVLDRMGVVIAATNTHYKILFQDGTISWYRISFLKDADNA